MASLTWSPAISEKRRPMSPSARTTTRQCAGTELASALSIINFYSNEDLEREYQEMAQKVREMPEEDLTIYHEEDLTEQEK